MPTSSTLEYLAAMEGQQFRKAQAALSMDQLREINFQAVQAWKAHDEAVRRSAEQQQRAAAREAELTAAVAAAKQKLEEVVATLRESGREVRTVYLVHRDDAGQPFGISVGTEDCTIQCRILPGMPAAERDRIAPGCDVILSREGVVVAVARDCEHPGTVARVEQQLPDGRLRVTTADGSPGQLVEPLPALSTEDMAPGTLVQVRGGVLATAVVQEANHLADAMAAEVPKTRWEDIFGPAKDEIERRVILPFCSPALFAEYFSQSGVRGPWRTLFVGPPGTGKTCTARAIANRLARELNIDSMFINWRPRLSPFVNEQANSVRELRRVIDKLTSAGALVTVYLDDIDVLISSRAGVMARTSFEDSKTLGEFLHLLDGFEPVGNGRLLVIASCNRPVDLDQALLRRFDVKVSVPYFRHEDALAHVRHLLARVPVATTGRQRPDAVRDALSARLARRLTATDDDRDAYLELSYRSPDAPRQYLRRRDVLNGDLIEKTIGAAGHIAYTRDALAGRTQATGITARDLDEGLDRVDRDVIADLPVTPRALVENLYLSADIRRALCLHEVSSVVPVRRGAPRSEVLDVAPPAHTAAAG